MRKKKRVFELYIIVAPLYSTVPHKMALQKAVLLFESHNNQALFHSATMP